MKLKVLSFYIVLILALCVIISCAGDDGSAVSDNTVADDTVLDSDESSAEETVKAPDIEAVDGGGKDFVILNRKVTEAYNGHPYAEFFAESQTGDVLNDSVYLRNLAIEEKYNINISSVEDDDVKAIASKAILAGDDLYDIASLGLRYAFTLAVSDYLFDINEIPYLDFSQPWWMSNIISDTSIGGKNFFVSGDMNIGAFNTAGVTYFNKKLINDHNLDDPYQLVRDMKWTIDKLSEMSKAVTEDLNGDGVYNHEDKYGLDCSSFAWQPLFYGTNNLMIKKDSNDMPYFDASNEAIYDAIVKIITLLNNQETTLNVNHLSGFSDLGKLTVDMFKSDSALFFIELIYGVPPLRDMDSDFGLLPMPLYSETQSTYTTYLHTSNASTIVIPKTNDDLDLIGRVLEDMAYESYVKIRPVFYDIMLKTKFSRDNDSAEMLDIIYDNVKIDLALVMIDHGINIDGLLRGACTSGDTNIISTLAASEEVYNASIQTAIEILAK